MATPLQRMLTRAAKLPGIGAGLGMAIDPTGGAGPRGRKGQVMASSRSVTYQSPGQPQQIDQAADQMGVTAYLNSVFVMRCVRTIAETISGLPFVAGMDPFSPGDFNRDATLSRLLGPATPDAPGGPNPHLSSRAMWCWTIIQYIITGRFGWELQWDGPAGKRGSNIFGLWPLISSALAPIPINASTELWSGFQYQLPTGVINMAPEKVLYCWRPSVVDWRLPESVLQAAAIPIDLQRSIDQYHRNLLKNNMVATTLVVSPPYDEPDQRRSWEDQFLAEFTGIDKVGGTIFGYVDFEDGGNANAKPVQVERIAQTGQDAGLMTILQQAKIDITIALGVPESLIGNASQRTYSNADSEYRNYWTLTVLNLIAELQDHINLRLAPAVGAEVGWFDLSKVAALQPPSIFAPPDIAEAINMGVVTAQQVANVLGVPAANATTDSDTDTVMLGEESSSVGPGGKRSARIYQIGDARLLRHDAMPMNSYTYLNPELRKDTKVIEFRRPGVGAITTGSGFTKAQAITERVEGLRALATAKRLTSTVHDVLAKNYPEDTLDWIDDADWDGPKDVALDDVQMDRRPGGRDMDKVDGIAKAQLENPDGPANAPVVLVKTPSGRLKVADGYHRTLAKRRSGRKTVSAYVGDVSDEHGPWDREMHDRKKNRSIIDVEPLETRIDMGWYGSGTQNQPWAMPEEIEPKAILEAEVPYEAEDHDEENGVENAYVDELARRLHGAA